MSFLDAHPSLQYLILGMNRKLQLYEPFCGSKSRRSHIAIAIKFDNVSHAIMNDALGRTPHMKGVGMLVVSLRGINFGFWSHLGCPWQNAIIFSREGLV